MESRRKNSPDLLDMSLVFGDFHDASCRDAADAAENRADDQPVEAVPGWRGRQKRRGVTSIEYVFMASLIIVACVIAVQHFGQVTKNLFAHDAEKTKVMDVETKR